MIRAGATRRIMNCRNSGASGAANPVVGSLDFEDTSTQYLSMSDGDWGSYTRTKFAIAGSFYLEANGKEQVIMSKEVSNASNEWFLYIGSTNNIGFTSNNGGAFFTGPGSAFSAATWYSFLIHFDSANATSGDRIKIWVNNSAVTASSYTAPSAAVPTIATDVNIGRRKAFSGSGYFDGLIYSLAFFDNVLPTAAEVFDGSAGKLKNLSSITGVYSLLDGVSAVSDYVKTPNWTNNNTVITSATVP